MFRRLRSPLLTAQRRLAASAVLATLLLCGCASTGPAREKNPDPLEGFNRGVYKFNDVIDRNALKPVARAYRDHVPKPVQTGVGNFFTNLGYPATVVNQFLQGKFKQGGQDTLRFLINTTLGWAGIFDVASGARLPIHDEDSGQTLGRWGVPAGPYLVLPFLGPANLRDAPARVADDLVLPFRWYDSGNERWFSLAVDLVDTRAGLLPLDRVLSEAYDPYAFIRDAYQQRRQYEVYDGDPPQDAAAAEDDADWAEEALKEDEAAAAGGAVNEGDGGSEGDGAGEPAAEGPPGAAGGGSATDVPTTSDPDAADESVAPADPPAPSPSDQ
jgi:phospholipid-binding lipoprotein MlaA